MDNYGLMNRFKVEIDSGPHEMWTVVIFRRGLMTQVGIPDLSNEVIGGAVTDGLDKLDLLEAATAGAEVPET